MLFLSCKVSFRDIQQFFGPAQVGGSCRLVGARILTDVIVQRKVDEVLDGLDLVTIYLYGLFSACLDRLMSIFRRIITSDGVDYQRADVGLTISVPMLG